MNCIEPTTDEAIDAIVAEVLQGKQRIISYPHTSQYGPDGTGRSACGLAALNCARIVMKLHEERNVDDGVKGTLLMFSRPAMEDIISICSAWQSSEHLEVDELLQVPVFKNAFETLRVEYGRTGYPAFLSLIRRLESVAGQGKATILAAIITRPPEILVCLRIPTSLGRTIFAVFDSHPRPTHPLGSGFILNSSPEATAKYLDEILGIDPSILSDPSMRWQAELLSQFCSHIVIQKDRLRCASDVDFILMEASMSILRLRTELAESRQRESYLATENEDMQSRLADLEDAIHSVDAVGKGKGRWDFGNTDSNGGEMVREVGDDKPIDDATAAIRLQTLCDEEHQELTSQRKALITVFGTFECQICFESFSCDHVCQFDICKHSFCRDCLKNHIASTLNARRYPIPCPSCVAAKAQETSMVDDLMFESLGPTTQQVAIFRELQLASYSIVIHCRKCEETMFVDREEYQASRVIACPLPRCNYIWCKNCQQTIEMGGPDHSCDGSSELAHLMKRRGWRHCPGCQTPIQKESGCNHMTCVSPGCNTQVNPFLFYLHFCYICGESMVQSLNRAEIRSAISAHYRKCHLFEY
ncbi:hypothetical protein CVT26_007270 [Gymnopilus dilepis]|uniref:RING-type domain-containing protein n=1 Tax=Gymnopilus dilepis TaxID=231916 RepID=A0A409W1H7_9AGAR|nr:hypothetical protein CVT26_007270 [Gymnopilus dilepis]